MSDIPWGTHVCQLYENRSDLLEIVIPFFQAGLDGNELCLWIACEPCDPDAALDDLRRAFADADRRIDAGDIEIISCSDGYPADDELDAERVVARWRQKLECARARGHHGMRIHANHAWPSRATCDAFSGYPGGLAGALAGEPMIVLCTYPLAGSSRAGVLDVAGAHELTLARENGAWEVLQTPELAAASAEIQRLHAELRDRDRAHARELADAHAALRESEDLYRFLAENTHDLITLYTVDGLRVYVSPSFARLMGEVPALYAGVHPEDLPAVRDAWERTLAGEKTLSTFRHAHADGSWRWVEASGTLVHYRGRPHVLAVTRDITERRESEQAHVWFLESLDRVNRAIQGTTDLEQMMSDVLDAVIEIFDADVSGLLYPLDPDAPRWSLPMLRMRPGIDGEAVALEGEGAVPRTPDAVRMYRLIRDSGEPEQFGPGPGQHPQPDVNDLFGIRSSMSTAVHPKGDQPYIFGIGMIRHPKVWSTEEERLAREIGRRLADGLTSLTMLRSLRESERELRVSESRFRIFVDHATDAFFLHDDQGTVLDANRQACKSLGYTREELVGMTPRDFDPGADEATIRKVGERLARGEVLAFDSHHRRKDGTVFPVEIRARPFTEAGRRYAVFLVRDVTERKRLEEEFRQAQKMEAIGRLAGGVAHDFNNLLTAILGYADLVLHDLPEDSAVAADVAEIRLAGERARGVTRQLLAFSRRQVLQPQIVDVGAVISGIERMLRLLVREDIHFEVRTCERPLTVRVDPIQIEQVLMNLVMNARDATGPGGRIVVDCSFSETGPDRAGTPDDGTGYARIVVSDTGTGMAPEIAEKVFEPFFTTKPSGVGTGLGLSTVYGILKQSGGDISVESEPGEGTRFTVLLPVTAQERSAAEEVELRKHALQGMEVVVVEDEDAVRHFVVDSLLRNGVKVLAFASPGVALTVLGDPYRPVDVLITDVILPGMSGPEMVERLRPARPDLRVIYISGYTADEAVFTEQIQRASVLQKPFGAEALLECLSAAGG